MAQLEPSGLSDNDYSNLLLLVDIANIRPRRIRDKKKFFTNFGMRWRGYTKTRDDFTNFEFIDQCLLDLIRSAPGAVIIKYADYALREFLEPDDVAELNRRASLDDFHQDKIFVVSTTKADNPLLTASLEIGGSIVSQDGFSDAEYQELKSENTRLFVHSYNEDYEQFDFVTREGVHLSEWWSDNNQFVSGDWLASDEYLDIDFRIRSKVRQANWQWITVPLVHNPEIPEEVFESIEARSRGPRRLTKTKRSSRRPKKSSLAREEVFVEEDSFVLEITEPEVEFEFSTPRRVQPVRYLLADDFHGMRKNLGNLVTVAGRIVLAEGKVFLQWIPGTEAIEIINHPIIAADGMGSSFVQLDGVLEAGGSSFVLRTDDDEKVAVVSYAQIREQLNIQKRESRVWAEQETSKWFFPNFIDSVRNLKSIRQVFLPTGPVDDLTSEDSEPTAQSSEADYSKKHQFLEEKAQGTPGNENLALQVSSVDSKVPSEVSPTEKTGISDDCPREQEDLPADGRKRDAGHGTIDNTPPTSFGKEDIEFVVSNPSVRNDHENLEFVQAEEKTAAQKMFPGRRIIIGVILTTVLVLLGLLLNFTMGLSDSSDSKMDVSVQPSVAEWRYFESVVWRK